RAAHAARVEAQHGKAALGEHVEEIIDDLVVHRAAELRMRVQDDGHRRIRLLARLVPAFQTPFRAVEDHFWHEFVPAFSGFVHLGVPGPTPGGAHGLTKRGPLPKTWVRNTSLE